MCSGRVQGERPRCTGTALAPGEAQIEGLGHDFGRIRRVETEFAQSVKDYLDIFVLPAGVAGQLKTEAVGQERILFHAFQRGDRTRSVNLLHAGVAAQTGQG
jgi:hypothetical protein